MALSIFLIPLIIYVLIFVCVIAFALTFLNRLKEIVVSLKSMAGSQAKIVDLLENTKRLDAEKK